ncbi:MAG: serine/threonine-protein phosphatase, partial [Chromatiales bacterium]|nr:serine/threonine-protein phosphatase [Chromatiales bacterium]
GDSRLYRLRGTAFELVSRDHTQFEELLKQGLLDDNASETTHPTSHILTRALGVEKQVELEVEAFEVGKDDVFLLCSDGLSNVVEQLEMAKAIYYSEDKERAISNLINMALAGKANDNVTAVIIDGKQ